MILERGETCDERFPSFISDVIYAHVKIEINRFIRVYNIGKKVNCLQFKMAESQEARSLPLFTIDKKPYSILLFIFL